jgi:hypothetical protein
MRGESGYNCLFRRAGVGKPREATRQGSVFRGRAAGPLPWQSCARRVVLEMWSRSRVWNYLGSSMSLSSRLADILS